MFIQAKQEIVLHLSNETTIKIGEASILEVVGSYVHKGLPFYVVQFEKYTAPVGIQAIFFDLV